MTVTAQRLLTELGRRAWSGFNADDMIFSSEDADQAKAELNAALRYLINLEDFPFRAKEQSLNLHTNGKTYSVPEGQITTIYNTDTLEQLQFIGDNSQYDKTAAGTPSGYWIVPDNPGQTLRIYPIPDKSYKYTIVYNQYKPVIDTDGETYFEFQKAADFINMPENLEYLFMDCVVLRTMIQNNVDDQDENFQPLINEFNEVWKIFKRACRPAKTTTKVVW